MFGPKHWLVENWMKQDDIGLRDFQLQVLPEFSVFWGRDGGSDTRYWGFSLGWLAWHVTWWNTPIPFEENA